VLVVAPSGQPYSQIQDAVDNAAEGDTILVKTGNYASFVISARSLAIVGDEGANVQIAGAIRVRNLGGSQRVLLTRLTANGVYAATGFGQYGLYATNNVGALRVEGCALKGAAGTSTHPDGYAGVWLENCFDVALHESTCVGGAGKDGWAGIDTGRSGDGVRASGCTLAVASSVVRGGSGLNGSDCWNSPDGGDGGDGLHLVGSVVWLHAGTARGGDGGDGKQPTSGCSCSTGAFGGTGGYALLGLGSSVVYVQGTQESAAFSGDSWGGLCGFYMGTQMPLRSGGSFVTTTAGPRRLNASAVRRESQDTLLEVRGQAGDAVQLVLSERTQAARYLNAWQGMELVTRSTPMRLMHLGTLPASGIGQFSLPAQDLGPGVSARAWHLQLLVDEPGGVRRLGEAASVLRLDSAY
jgi:hypothetical protein